MSASPCYAASTPYVRVTRNLALGEVMVRGQETIQEAGSLMLCRIFLCVLTLPCECMWALCARRFVAEVPEPSS